MQQRWEGGTTWFFLAKHRHKLDAFCLFLAFRERCDSYRKHDQILGTVKNLQWSQLSALAAKEIPSLQKGGGKEAVDSIWGMGETAHSLFLSLSPSLSLTHTC